jgi:hypothetical protein
MGEAGEGSRTMIRKEDLTEMVPSPQLSTIPLTISAGSSIPLGRQIPVVGIDLFNEQYLTI